MNRKLFKILSYFFSITFLLSFQSCVLTNSQVRLTKNYYSKLNEIDTYCRTLKEAASQVEYERRQMYPESYSDDSVMVDELIDSYQTYTNEISHSDTLLQKINVLGSYLNNYTILLPKQRTKSTGYDRRVLTAVENFSSYLPFGIGLTVYKTIYDLVTYTTRFFGIPHARKKMKEFITRGEKLVPENANYISQEFKVISEKLVQEEIMIRENYIKLLKNQKTNKEPMNYYQTYNPVFLNKYHLAFSCKELSDEIVLLLPALSQTYNSLFEETRKRKKIKSELSGMSDFNILLSRTKKHFATLSQAKGVNKSQ